MQDNRSLLPDDVFRARRDQTVAALRQWSAGLSDCARVDEENAARYWRLAVRPLAVGACPLEMIVHQRQTCDLALGAETYEDRLVEELDRLLPLAEAIIAGRVLTRLRRSANTGACLAIETLVRLPGDQVWQADRWIGGTKLVGPTTLEDRWYLPYRRE